jgi:hypothetical protein
MRIWQLGLTFGRTTFIKEVVKPLSFLHGHVYTCRMKAESQILCWIHSKPGIHIIKTSVAKQTIFHVNPLWTCTETSNLLHLSWLSRQTNSLKNDLLKTIY